MAGIKRTPIETLLSALRSPVSTMKALDALELEARRQTIPGFSPCILFDYPGGRFLPIKLVGNDDVTPEIQEELEKSFYKIAKRISSEVWGVPKSAIAKEDINKIVNILKEEC